MAWLTRHLRRRLIDGEKRQLLALSHPQRDLDLSRFRAAKPSAATGTWVLTRPPIRLKPRCRKPERHATVMHSPCHCMRPAKPPTVSADIHWR